MEYCADNSLDLLLQRAKNEDADALEGLLEAYAPLIESRVLSFAEKTADPDDLDDLRQEASIALCNAAVHYDPEQNVSFGAFAKICINNRLVSYQRKRLRRLPTVSLESEHVEVTPDKADPLQTLVERDSFSALCRQIESVLSPYENSIWWLYVSGHTGAEIAERLSKPERSVQNAIYRIRKKLRASLPNQSFMPE